MNKLMKILKNRFDEVSFKKYGVNYRDAASGTLILTIIGSFMLVLCVGFVVDLSKNAYIKSVQNGQAQSATDAAIKTIDSQGNLLNFTKNPGGNVPDAVYKIIETYNSSNDSSSANKAESSVYRFKQCSTGNIKTYNSSVRTESTLPYMVITLDTARGVGNSANKIVYEVVGNNPPKLIDGKINTSVKYTAINAEITDGVGNFILGMFGSNCQALTSDVSSITFGSQSDLSNNS